MSKARARKEKQVPAEQPQQHRDYNSPRDYAVHHIGVPGLPFPWMFLTKNGYALGVIEDANQPLELLSEQDYDVMMGTAFREMPTPDMLDLFIQGIAMRHPTSKRRVQALFGAAGAGKTFMAKVLGRMTHQDGAEIKDCGGRDLSELLFETVLDLDRDRSLYDKIDERLASGKIHPLSVQYLREGLGDAFIEDESGRVRIDWKSISGASAPNIPLSIPEPAPQQEGGVIGFLRGLLKGGRQQEHLKIDANLMQAGFSEELTRAIQALREVIKLEGLEQHGNSLGLAVRFGPAIRCFIEDRPLIADEYTKGKIGTGGELQVFWQFMIGEIDEHTVSRGPLSFTFRRQDMGPGFFITLTSNMLKDGPTNNVLDESTYHRIVPRFIDNPRLEGWQHRICQMLTGIPLSTLYKMDERRWKQAPEAFTRLILGDPRWEPGSDKWPGIRRFGLSERQIDNIPEWQFAMLKAWPEVLEASDMLAKFYYGWSQYLDPESDVHKTQGMAAVAAEIDPHYSSMIGVGLRMAMRHINDAMQVLPEVRSASQTGGFDLNSSWKKGGGSSTRSTNDIRIAQEFGTRLKKIILDDIYATTMNIQGEKKKATFAMLSFLAGNTGIAEIEFDEAFRSNKKLLEELLNIDIHNQDSPHTQAGIIRDLLCDFLRERFPELADRNDDIITVARVETALQHIRDDIARGHNSTHTAPLYVPNTDHRTLSSQPLQRRMAVDSTPLPGYEPLYLEADRLLDHETLLVTLAMPGLGKQNLDRLWNHASTNSGEQGAHFPELDKALAMEQNRSDTGLAITTVLCRALSENGQETTMPLHIVRDTKPREGAPDGLTLIVGGAISPSLKRQLAQHNIEYVDRGAADAKKSIDRALDVIFKPRSNSLKDTLKEAFLMRNAMAPGRSASGYSINELLAGAVRQDHLPEAGQSYVTHCFRPNNVTEFTYESEMQHLFREIVRRAGNEGAEQHRG